MNTITIYQGESKTIPLTIKKDGVVFDLTGFTANFTLKKKLGDTDANKIYISSVTSHVNATAGETAFEITKAESVAFPKGTFVYEIELVKAEILTVITNGEFIIKDKLKD